MRNGWLRLLAPCFCLFAALGLATAVLPAVADDPGADPATQYRSLVREYKDAQEVFFKALAAAKTDAERRKALARKPDPAEHAERFFELARKNARDPAAFDALSWVLTYSPHGPAADEALELVALNHAESPRLGPILQRLAVARSEATEAFLRAVLAKNTSREIQAQAFHGLALVLEARANRPAPAMPLDQAPAPDQVVLEFPNDAKKEVRDDPSKSPRDEAIALFTRLGNDYGTLKYAGKKTYGDLARAGLARLSPSEVAGAHARRSSPASGANGDGPPLGLEVGMRAPEIEGLDTNGRPMRLSTFRGNVVVLDFWGDWCPYCQAMYPDERTLVNRLRGKPFALLGINSDKDLNSLFLRMSAERINWRSWWDGGTRGPITSAYGVQAWPTIFVLDARGVIRFKGVRGAALDRAVEFLIDERAQDAKAGPGSPSGRPATKVSPLQ
jgi:thiol-disulfide isomerase/thioredoxin